MTRSWFSLPSDRRGSAARLRVDEVRGERAGIAAEERVQASSHPREAPEVKADEELRARVEQPPAQVGDAAAGEAARNGGE